MGYLNKTKQKNLTQKGGGGGGGLLSFTHLHVSPNLFDWLSSVEHESRCVEKQCSERFEVTKSVWFLTFFQIYFVFHKIKKVLYVWNDVRASK